MKIERRIEERQTQDDLKRMLNKQQMNKLRQMETTGWKILFIRNHLFEPMVTALSHLEDGSIVVLEEDGSINQEHDINIRNYAAVQ